MNQKHETYGTATPQRHKNERYRLVIDLDSLHASCVPDSTPYERNPVGKYHPDVVGTQAEIERMVRRFRRKPCLVEKLVKILPD